MFMYAETNEYSFKGICEIGDEIGYETDDEIGYETDDEIGYERLGTRLTMRLMRLEMRRLMILARWMRVILYMKQIVI